MEVLVPNHLEGAVVVSQRRPDMIRVAVGGGGVWLEVPGVVPRLAGPLVLV